MSTKVVRDGDLFNIVNGETKLIRGIISDLHPLGKMNNSAIVVAFVEASFAHQIRETVRKNIGLSMGKIKVLIHLPPILDALHNAALLARKEMLDEAKRIGQPRKIHCNVSMVEPWVQLVEMKDGEKEPIPFRVQDGRLWNPADTMAVLALTNKKFVPFKLLPNAEKAAIRQGVMRPATPIVTNIHPPAPATPAPATYSGAAATATASNATPAASAVVAVPSNLAFNNVDMSSIE